MKNGAIALFKIGKIRQATEQYERIIAEDALDVTVLLFSPGSKKHLFAGAFEFTDLLWTTGR